MNAFAAVLDAVSALQAGDAQALRSAVSRVPAKTFFDKAVAHRCAGMIFAAMARYRIQDPQTLELWRMLQGYAGMCSLDSERTQRQIDGIAEAFSEGRVPHALLKGAARLRARDCAAQWSHMDDLDILIPAERGDAAAEALLARGYHFECDSRAQQEYKTEHHHLAPLTPEGGGKSVELHVSLEYPPWFSTRTDWALLAEHLIPEDGMPQAFRLDPFGRALHALIHAVGLYRLGDVAILATELRRTPNLLQPLRTWSSNERKQHVALRAILVLAQQIAGLPAERDAASKRYLEWVMWREDSPRWFQKRAQLLDAYFSRELSLVVPYVYEGETTIERMCTGGVRLSAGIAAAAYRALRPV
jgi:hypothetical protein